MLAPEAPVGLTGRLRRSVPAKDHSAGSEQGLTARPIRQSVDGQTLRAFRLHDRQTALSQSPVVRSADSPALGKKTVPPTTGAIGSPLSLVASDPYCHRRPVGGVVGPCPPVNIIFLMRHR